MYFMYEERFISDDFQMLDRSNRDNPTSRCGGYRASEFENEFKQRR